MAEQKFETHVVSEPGHLSMTITKSPNEAPDDTSWGAAKQILALPEEGVDGLTKEQAIEAIVKRYGHFEKLRVYSKIDRFLEEDGSNVKWIRECLISPKIDTHYDFAHRPLDMQIYGQGKWSK